MNEYWDEDQEDEIDDIWSVLRLLRDALDTIAEAIGFKAFGEWEPHMKYWLKTADETIEKYE